MDGQDNEKYKIESIRIKGQLREVECYLFGNYSDLVYNFLDKQTDLVTIQGYVQQ
jgi:hypothetical protein